MPDFQFPPFRGCIFGLDGVLVDTARYHFQAWKRLAAALGHDLPADTLETLRNLTRMECLEQILDWGDIYMTDAEKMMWADIKNNWYIESISHMKPGEVLPGVVLFLRQLKSRGIKTALSSTSQNAPTVLRSLRLEPYFDTVLDGEMAGRSKRDPQVFKITAAALGLSPEDCLVFEDAPLGYLAARQGGFTVVGVGQGASDGAAHFGVHGFANVGFEQFSEALAAGAAA